MRDRRPLKGNGVTMSVRVKADRNAELSYGDDGTSSGSSSVVHQQQQQVAKE